MISKRHNSSRSSSPGVIVRFSPSSAGTLITYSGASLRGSPSWFLPVHRHTYRFPEPASDIRPLPSALPPCGASVSHMEPLTELRFCRNSLTGLKCAFPMQTLRLSATCLYLKSAIPLLPLVIYLCRLSGIQTTYVKCNCSGWRIFLTGKSVKKHRMFIRCGSSTESNLQAKLDALLSVLLPRKS